MPHLGCLWGQFHARVARTTFLRWKQGKLSTRLEQGEDYRVAPMPRRRNERVMGESNADFLHRSLFSGSYAPMVLMPG